MSFGFSVGDFVAVAKIITDLLSSLREAGGAKSDYQELIRELEGLKRALHHVDTLHSRNAASQAAVASIKCAALLCQHPLDEFLRKIQKYEKSLGLKATSSVKSAVRKVEWSFGRKEEIGKLRDYLNLHVGSINMLLVSHGLQELEVMAQHTKDDNSTLKELLEDSRKEIIADSRTSIISLQRDAQNQALAVKENGSMISRLYGIISSDVTAPLKTLSDMVHKVCTSTQQICSIALEIRGLIPSVHTGFTYFQAPVRIEDALGRIFPVPSEFSFSDLEAVIRNKFSIGPGRSHVQNGLYELVNTRNRKQVISTTGGVGLLPGMNLVMVVIMEELPVVATEACPMPHCHSENTKTAPGGGRSCVDCGIWFDEHASKKRKREKSHVEEILEGADWDGSEPPKTKKRRATKTIAEDTTALRNIKTKSLELLVGQKIYKCRTCSKRTGQETHFANHDDIISRNFRGQHGKAYLFDSVVNITTAESQERNMTTGRHRLRDAHCRQCDEVVGWYYEHAYESVEMYKVGKYVLEAELLAWVK